MEGFARLFAVVLVAGIAGSAKAACTFNLDTSSPTYPPHFVDSSGKIVHPTLQGTSRIITLAANQQITVACEGSGNVLLATNAQLNAASCTTAGSTLRIGTQSLGYSALGCKSQPAESFVEKGTCGSGGTNIEEGFQVGTTFINLITICHDKTHANTQYSMNIIYGAHIAADDKANARPGFRKSSYFTGIDVITAYTQAAQATTVAGIVGSATLGSQYIDVGKSYYFACGHLAPDGDFIDAASQDATYYYINVAPQWQSFNNGNWKELESDTRAAAIARSVDWTIYTGTYGILTLADVNNRQQPIYLAKDANNNNVIPAPKYYWKMVHDPAARKAVVVIGINNPHLTSVVASDVFCTDICSQITWVSWTNRFDIPKGYMFCCSVSDFRNTVTFAPNLGTVSLLN